MRWKFVYKKRRFTQIAVRDAFYGENDVAATVCLQGKSFTCVSVLVTVAMTCRET